MDTTGNCSQFSADFSRPRFDSPCRRGATIRTVVAASLIAILLVIGALVALRIFVAQRIPELSEATLHAAENIWQHAGPENYNMDIVLAGAQPGAVHVEVRKGVATALARDGRVPAERTWQYWTVPGRFQELERELELAEDPEHEMQVEANTRLRLRCEFDSQFGFPRIYHRMVFGGGPEVYWRVTNFEAL